MSRSRSVDMIRRARTTEAETVIDVLDTALLSFDRDAIRRLAGGPSVTVAVGDERIRGAIVIENHHLVAIAVAPQYRRRGIGTALVERAGRDRAVLTGTCREAVYPFFGSLGFSAQILPDRRLFIYRWTDSEQRFQ